MSNDLSKYRGGDFQDNSSRRPNKPGLPSYYIPVLLALMLGIGFFAGKRLAFEPVFVKNSPKANPSKILKVLNQLDERYVEKVDDKELIDVAIRAMLEKLDPHSYYISQDEFQSMHESMQGNFDGIGIEFMIVKDTLTVVTPIEGGPSQKAGLLAGDQIIKADSTQLAGVGLTNSQVVKALKGERGTKVKLTIQRKGEDELKYFTITRDKIPIHSVMAAFMKDDNTGYIKVNRFARNTYEEFKEGLEKLNAEGMTDLVIDLRGNGGGYMDQAIRMIEEFLDKGDLIVFTKGRDNVEQKEFSSHRGKYDKNHVVVLINQGSASASEIVTGALQDQDRSITVGRRSFGKGLVQNEIPLGDNSAVRITIAHYYTPTGRCIQKPYGDTIDYRGDYEHRWQSGELLSADSIHFADSLMYTTPKGRVVYGGGGIMPDVFVPIDTAGLSTFFNHLNYRNIFREFGFKYANEHSELKTKYIDVESFDKNYQISDQLLNELVDYAASSGIDKNAKDLEYSKELIKLRLKANMAKNLYDDNAFYYILLDDDKDFQKGMEVLDHYDSYFEKSIARGKELLEKQHAEVVE